MGSELIFVMWAWVQGQKLCVTDDMARVPSLIELSKSEVKMPISVFGETSTPDQAREAFRRKRLWLLMRHCPRFESEI
jgi:hypothetical protein